MTYTVQEASLTGIADAIRTKTKSEERLTFPDGFVEAIGSIKSGGGAAVAEKDVNFYDYDGTLVAAYTENEAKALKGLPTPPEHDGLTFQGWNYTLDEVNKYAEAADVGALYTTDDGKTKIYIDVGERKNVQLKLAQTLPKGVIVDWGDGVSKQSWNSTNSPLTFSHTYDNPGSYVITIQVLGECTITLGGGTSCFIDSAQTYNQETAVTIRRIYIGDGVKTLAVSAFSSCYDLEILSIPESVARISAEAMKSCRRLKHVTVPSAVTNIESRIFLGCSNLASVSLGPHIQEFSDAFTDCSSLRRIIVAGEYYVQENCVGAFSGCSALQTAVMSTTSPQVRYARRMFDGCNCLRKLVFHANVSGLGERAFCLSSLEKFEIPDSVVVDDGTVGHNFYQSYSLRECIMGSGCTVIPRNIFDSCYRLQRIECRGDVTSVSSGAINYCRSLKTLDLTHCSSVPSLTAAWYGTPDDLQILVPAALADEWKQATNWVTYADKIIGV